MKALFKLLAAVLVLALFPLFLIWRLLRALLPGRPATAAQPAVADDGLPAQYRRRWALALADILLRRNQLPTDSADLLLPLAPAARASLRAAVLQECGLAVQSAEAQPAAARRLLRLWLAGFSDEHHFFYAHCAEHESVRDALAFDCARVAFLVRCLALLELIPQDEAWLVLFLNAQRAQDVFRGWDDFGMAYARARAVWVRHAGQGGPASQRARLEVEDYLNLAGSNWRTLPWAAAAIFAPEPLPAEADPDLPCRAEPALATAN
ncbi:DUF1266 domain-containing protein [Chitinilyticum piscinae]|uniref:DUF1266 domain-containing protein n=1 Tax=Chitinilyticum piscinae TaxID=2866724 RepID=A0A8J7FKU9_9NEIS|nr:DUF1266 domain-containing protein [Chitinilyticum piscinae]MBE9608294.1 DUF1266 domain-containing protein [Chitinilyticum piscinae]